MASSSVYAAPVGTGADIQLPAKGEPPVKVTVDPTNSAQSAFTETPAGDNGGHLHKRDLLEQAVGKIDIKERAKMCVSVHIGSAEYSKYNCGSFPGAVPAPAGGPPTGPPAAGGAQDTSSILYGTLGTVDVDAKADVCLSLQVGSPEWHKNHCDEKKMLQHSPPNSGGGPGSPTGGNSKTPAVAGIIGNVDAKATVDVCLTLTQGAPEWYSHRCDQKNAPGGGAGAPDHEPAGPSAPGLVQKAVGDVSVVAKAKVCAGLTVGTAAYDANHCGDKDYNPGGGAGNPQTGGTGSLLDKVAGPINGDAKVDVCAKVVVGSAEYKRLGCTPKNDRDVTPGGNQPDDDDGPPSTTPGHDGLVSKTTGGVNVDAKVNVCASIAFGTPAYYQHGCANQVGGNPAPGGGPGTPPGQNPGSGIIDKIVGPGGADVTTDVCAHVTIASPEDVRKKCGFKGPDGPGTPPGGGPGTPPGGGPGTTPGGLIPGVTGPVDVSTNTNVCVGLTVGTPDYIKHNCGSKNPPPVVLFLLLLLVKINLNK
ncbi:hypothetical protein GQ42DRAFT_155328 [Ramicandelaber brevisporus]|nr:hypothetical protein GQ42DRAFT_155328 [Ramicandelaber brevisporus]